MITNKVSNTFTILHESGQVNMAPHMVYKLLKYNVLTKIDEFTYKVVDEYDYWKVMNSLN